MDHNVPLDVAFGMDEVTRAGWCIIFSELNGAKFDWSRMSFEEPK